MVFGFLRHRLQKAVGQVVIAGGCNLTFRNEQKKLTHITHGRLKSVLVEFDDSEDRQI